MVGLDLGPTALVLRQEGASLPISLKCPRFLLDEKTVGGQEPFEMKGEVTGRHPLQLFFPPIPIDGSSVLEVKLFLKWSPRESVLRKWARFRLTGSGTCLLREVILEDLDSASRPVRVKGNPPQSYPAFLKGFFAGIEFPVASTRVEEGRLLLAHRPGLKVQPGIWYETRRGVYGVAEIGREQEAFKGYIASHRPAPRGFHINYNSWWSSPAPYTEADILKLLNEFQEELYKPYGVSLDTFCIDLGWSDPMDAWRIDRKSFPDGFSKLQKAARAMGSDLGLWISPSAGYAWAVDIEAARRQGFETFTIGGQDKGEGQRYACLAGERYRARFRDCLVEMVTRFGVRHIKLDAYVPECSSSEHGHEPGPLSAEPVAEGLISALEAVRRAAPAVWVEPTCFGGNSSPWWALYTNSVTGHFGDDAPFGRVPCPIYRESYTTARDYFNLQGAALSPIPAAASEVLGLIHQSDDPFLNDAVMTIMRGHMFLPLYVNPKFMIQSRWRSLADLLKWARENADLLGATEPILPASWEGGKVPQFTNDDVMPREPYGYAHWKGRKGLVALRNPWAAPANFVLKLDDKIATPSGARKLSAISLYPEVRTYGADLAFGSELRLPLAPYETVVLSLASDHELARIPVVQEDPVQVMVERRHLARVRFGDAGKPAATGARGRIEGDLGIELQLDAEVSVDAPRASLLLLLEGEEAPPDSPVLRLSINGVETEPEMRRSVERSYHIALPSDTGPGWAASSLPAREHWLFLRAPLSKGRSRLSIDMLAGSDCIRLSAWVWATKPGNATSVYPNSLPQPELLSMGGKTLLALTQAISIPEATGQEARSGKGSPG